MALIYLTSKGFFNETFKNAISKWADRKVAARQQSADFNEVKK